VRGKRWVEGVLEILRTDGPDESGSSAVDLPLSFLCP